MYSLILTRSRLFAARVRDKSREQPRPSENQAMECTALVLPFFVAHRDGMDQILAGLVMPLFHCAVISYELSTTYERDSIFTFFQY